MRKKILGAIILGGLIYLGLTYFGLAPGLNRTESVVPQIVDLSGTPDVTPDTSAVAITIGALPGTKPASLRTPPIKVTMYPWTADLIVDLSGTPDVTPDTSAVAITIGALPGTKPASLRTPPIKVTMYPWTAELGILFATGGPQTTEGSLMATHGINLRLIRQDSLDKMRAEHLAFANALAGGQQHPTTGTHFIIMMGDGSAQYKSALNEALKELGPEYKARTVGRAHV